MDFLSPAGIVLYVASVLTVVRFTVSKIERRSFSLWAAVSEDVMAGFMALGLLTYLVLPTPAAVVDIFDGFAPHAYNLLIWPAGALLVLRKRFGSALIFPAFAMVYGLEELIWNPFALAEFWGKFAFGQPLWYVTTRFWQMFIVACALGLIMGAFIVAPRIGPYASTFAMLVVAFMSYWAFGAGLPAGATDAVSTAWELMWQGIYWLFVAGTFYPRAKT
ncbi:MAG: hypothetical protein JRN50_02245 [Nitrososphaerota archaeon]|nr:hypothetical protein [Nitrososphaerota archaeon]